MFNLIELLTVIIGLLLALVFVDGIRRSIRNRKSRLKVDLVPASEIQNLPESQEEDLPNFTLEEENTNNLNKHEQDTVDTTELHDDHNRPKPTKKHNAHCIWTLKVVTQRVAAQLPCR